MSTKKDRYIPIKNYVIAIVVVAAIVLLTLYGFSWYKVYEDNKVNKSYLVNSNTVIHEIKSLDEMDSALLETNEIYFVYVSYTGSKDVYNLEKGLQNIIKNYGLKDCFYYLNVTDLMKEDNYLDKINEALNLTDNKIEKVPTILMFKDGALVKDGIVKRNDNNMMESGDFEKMLETREISKGSL